MKTKTIISGVISAAVCISMLTACSGKTETQGSMEGQDSTQSVVSEKSSVSEQSAAPVQDKDDEQSAEDSENSRTDAEGGCTLTVRDPEKNAEITATFSNTTSGASEDIRMEKTDEKDDHYIFTCKGDAEKYNVVRFSYGNTVTRDAAFNKCVSGWELFAGDLMPYDINSDKDFELKYETKTFNVSGLEKNVYIWTPDDYDADSAEKYSVIYMLDGQTVLTTELSSAIRSWNVAQHTASMMSATGNKAILVCIDAGETRDDDYSPALPGDANCNSSSNPCGRMYADFICSTIMPYINKTYNVYTDAAHTSIAGSSMGGLEAFFIGMEYPAKFGTAGVFSPSFWAYSDDDWKAYFAGKSFGENCAFLYFYSGSFSQDTGMYAESVYNALIEAGYPKDRLVFSKNETGEHKEEFWSNIYPEFLEAMLYGGVSALESGAPVKYIDRTPPKDLDMIEQTEKNNNEPDTRPDYIKNYVFFDNSEMKWDTVWAYWFGPTGESPINKATGEDEYGNPMWPGLQMEQIEGTDIYRIVAPLDVSAIIFSNGVLDEDVKKGALAYQTADLLYSDAACSGKIYTIDTSVAAVKGTGVEKTKSAYPGGKWVPYEG